MEHSLRPVRRNKEGFTLVEVLVAMVIILVLLLGLVQAALLSTESNLRNVFRDEAARIAEQRMNGTLTDKNDKQYRGLRDHNFDEDELKQNYPDWTCTDADISRNFRSIAKDYAVCWRIRDFKTSADIDTTLRNTKTLEVAVGWNYKGEVPAAEQPKPTKREYQHSIGTILRRPI
jgi:prepilin-type N-terminal cleavage/methylation domain-containing protein